MCVITIANLGWRKGQKKTTFKQGFRGSKDYIDRTSMVRWEQQGSLSFNKRACDEVKKLTDKHETSYLHDNTKNELIKLMKSQARRYGQDKLPDLPHYGSL